VATGAVDDPVARVSGFVQGLAGVEVSVPVRIRLDQVGDGYSSLTGPVREALGIAARSEGVALDPIYTGRALAGLAQAVREGTIRPGERTVFLHSGGLPGLFGHPDALRLS
jgi:D-cysteine desulfhydrase